MCPICAVRRALFKTKKLPSDFTVPGIDNSLSCPTPPMGWSSWNSMRGFIDEGKILSIAGALKSSGLLNAGYVYLNLDDCWQSSLRDENNEMQGDFVNFPMGIPALFQKIHDLGLKCGIYSSCGTETCEDYPASLYNETTDANTFLKMGADYLKYDYCHNEKISKYAPLICKIELTSKDTGKTTEFQLEKLNKYGFAMIRNICKIKCVTGIDKCAGGIEFYTDLTPGKYVLTITYVKRGRYEKYLGIRIKDKYYEMNFAGTKAWSKTARAQSIIELPKNNGSYGNNIYLFNPIKSNRESAFVQYRRMLEAFKTAGESANKKVVFSICEWGRNKPYLWGADAGNLWRTTPDIRPNFMWINTIYRHNLKLYKYAQVGGFNDPDMLEVGNGKLSYEQNKTHFSLWCMMASPLILGNDLRKIDLNSDKDKKILSIISNKELIAIDQDALCKPAKLIQRTFNFDVIARPLSSGFAVLIYNRSNIKRAHTLDLNLIVSDPYLNAEHLDNYKVCELWSGNEFTTDSKITSNLNGQSVAVYRILR